MTDHFADEVRAALSVGYVRNPQLADDVFRRLRDPQVRGHRRGSRTASVFAAVAPVIAAIAVVATGMALVVAGFPGRSPSGNQGSALSRAFRVMNLQAAAGPLLLRYRTVYQQTPSGPIAVQESGIYQRTPTGDWALRVRIDALILGTSFGSGGLDGVIWTVGPACSDCNPVPVALSTYVTTDGGVHWTSHRPTSWSGLILLANFIGLEGWAAPEAGAPLYHTADGGATWTQVGYVPGVVYRKTDPFFAGPLRFADSSSGWLATGVPTGAGHSGLFHTTDGGRSWTEQALTRPAALASSEIAAGVPFFSSRTDGVLPVVFGGQGSAGAVDAGNIYTYRTSDGGATWSGPTAMFAKTPGISALYRQWVFFLDVQHWWVVLAPPGTDSTYAVLARTSDGGTTWQVDLKAPRFSFLQFKDSQTGWGSIANGSGPTSTMAMLKTRDGGKTWTQLSDPDELFGPPPG